MSLPQIHSVLLKFTQIISVSVRFAQSLQTHLLSLRLKSRSESLNRNHIHPFSYKFIETMKLLRVFTQIQKVRLRFSPTHSDLCRFTQPPSNSFRFAKTCSDSLKLNGYTLKGRGKLTTATVARDHTHPYSLCSLGNISPGSVAVSHALNQFHKAESPLP